MKKGIRIALTAILAFMLMFSFAQPVVWAADVSGITILVSMEPTTP